MYWKNIITYQVITGNYSIEKRADQIGLLFFYN
nr:MAG TPA: hypothetical protein [Caudoviricetes sp.]